MHFNVKTIGLLFFFFNLLFTGFAKAECNGNECNLERKSTGMWYGDANLIGEVNQAGFSSEPYAKWFVDGYKKYKTDPVILEKIRQNNSTANKELEITVFMGTWCRDSQMHVPRLYKILDQSGFDREQINVHALGIAPNEFRKTPYGIAEKGQNIHRVPTIIVSNNNVELGRIVESPAATLEQDLLTLVQGGSYTPAAHILEGEVNDYLERNGLEKFKENLDLLANDFRDKDIKEDELDSYIAYNLLYAKRYKEAEAVINMMLLIFPEAGHLHLTLARTYELLKNDYRALSSYRRAFYFIDDDGNMDLIRGALSRSAELK
jgi:hypothetical protein